VTVWSAVCVVAALGAALAWYPSRRWVRRRVAAPGTSPSRLASWVMPLGVALLVWTVVGGAGGVACALLAAVGVKRLLNAGSSRDQQRAQTSRALAMPVALDVLTACLSVGATQADALHAVAASLGGSLADDLRTVASAMALGADATEAWTLVAATDLHPLGSLLSRADVTGAPVTPLLVLMADQHRQRAHAAAVEEARALGVRLAAPLGLCFLPAFVLVAVVPLVMSLVPSWL
jgi:pilus assembly protein TadC